MDEAPQGRDVNLQAGEMWRWRCQPLAASQQSRWGYEVSSSQPCLFRARKVTGSCPVLLAVTDWKSLGRGTLERGHDAAARARGLPAERETGSPRRSVTTVEPASELANQSADEIWHWPHAKKACWRAKLDRGTNSSRSKLSRTRGGAAGQVEGEEDRSRAGAGRRPLASQDGASGGQHMVGR
jgi:hypothetical protein